MTTPTDTTPTDLFRREALEYWSRQRGAGAELRVGAPWVPWLYWFVLALVAVGLALTFFTRIEQTTSGPALVDPQKGTFVAVLPAAAASELRDGRPVGIEVNGPTGSQDVVASAGHVEAAAVAEIRRAGFTSFPEPGVLVTGVLPGAADLGGTSSPGLSGRAVVELGSQRALPLFLNGVRGAPEGEDG